jgi:hypothetical protein
MACNHFPTVSGVCVLIHSAASLAVISTLYGIAHLFLVIAHLFCAFPLPYCTQLFHCLSTDRRPAPFHSYASQILSIALLCRSSPLLRLASPFHRFAIPGLASPFRCFAIPGSSIPCHRSTVQCLCFANLSRSVTKQFVAFPYRCISSLFLRFASRSDSMLFLCFSCHFFAHRTAAYPLHSQPSKSSALSILALPFPS